MLLGDAVDALSIVNSKLFELCSTKDSVSKNPADYTKEQLVDLIKKDVALCCERSKLRNILNKMTPGVTNIVEEVKLYGN